MGRPAATRVMRLQMFWPVAHGAVLYTGAVQLKRSIFTALLLSAVALAGNPQPTATLHWDEGSPGCSIRRSEEGRTYYRLASQDFDFVLGVDNQELEKIRHRAVPMLGVLVSVNYKQGEVLPVVTSQSTLEFSKHFQVMQKALDPDTLLQQLQQDMDELTDEITHHQMRKHPELKDAKEAELQQRLKDYTEMMDFISTSSLREGGLDASKTSASGWIFFSIQNRWIGPWRRPEQFVFRMPLANAMVEIPFELPPKGGKLELRPRPAR